jgi:hypothetical protein
VEVFAAPVGLAGPPTSRMIGDDEPGNACPGGVRGVAVIASAGGAVGLGHMTIDGELTLRPLAAGRGVCRWVVECSPLR